MARFEFKLPDIGEGVAEGEIVAWHVKPGDQVKEDQAMVEVMTDKATVTIGAPKKGAIVETRAEVGAIVPVGTLLVVLEVDGAGKAADAPKAAPAKTEAPSSKANESQQKASAEGPAATAVGDIRDTVPGGSFFGGASQSTSIGGHAAPKVEPAPRAAMPVVDDGYRNPRPMATPAVRKLARDLGVDLTRVRATGDSGRIRLEDIRAFASQKSRPAETAAPARAAAGRPPVVITAPAGTAPGLEDRKPFVGMRRKIAERMQQSKQTAAHFTFVEECDVSRLKEIRARMKPQAEKLGVKLTFLPFIVKAVVAALKKHPVLNSALDESTNELVYRKYYHLGIAASTDQGLMVPVVKDADKRSLVDIAREIDRLGAAAKSGSIASSDLAGSTFTITSLGTQGGLFATPVLNFPEVGILGVHQIKQKPVVRDGQIVVGEVMLLSLSFDHRIVDGHVGAAFAYDIIQCLENPESMFLEMA